MILNVLPLMRNLVTLVLRDPCSVLQILKVFVK